MATNLSQDDHVRLENLEARLSDLEAIAKRIDPAVLLAVPEPVKVPAPAEPVALDAETLAKIKALLGL